MANGDHDWTAGEQVTAANMDDYLQLQTVQKFATSAARDAALSARKREGMVTYQDDANSLTNYSGAAWSTIGPVNGALTAWTPVLTQSGTVTTTVTQGSYQRVGRRITATCRLTVTGTGTATNLITISLPVTGVSASDGACIGSGNYLDTSLNNYMNATVTQANSGVSCYLSATLGTLGPEASTRIGSSFSTPALAAGDIISVAIMYEAAADG